MSCLSAVSLSAVMACQNVIGTGAVAAARASTGQGGSCASGTAVVVGMVVGCPLESGGGRVGTVAPPISRMDLPLPQLAAVTATSSVAAASLHAARRGRGLIPSPHPPSVHG